MPEPLNLAVRFATTDSTMQKDYMRCERYAFYKHGLNWHPATTSHHLTFGIAMHAAFEHLNRTSFDKAEVQQAFAEFCKVYDPEVPAELDMEHAPKNRANARLMLDLFVNKYQGLRYTTATLHGKPLVEVYGNMVYKMNTSQGIKDAMFVYKMDAVKTDGSRVYVFDYKTASAEMKYLDHMYDIDHQMNNYNLVLHSMFPPQVVGGVIVNVLLFRKGTKSGERGLDAHEVRSELPPNMLHARAANLLEVKRRMLEDGIQADAQFAAGSALTAFPLRDGACFKWGSTCEFYDLCRYRENPFEKMDLVPSHLKVEKWEPGKQNQELGD